MGEIDKDICKFTIPELHLYEKGDNGKIKFEIISDEKPEVMKFESFNKK